MQRLDIREVPTAVIYINGREIGRLQRTDWVSPETALKLMLSGPAAGKRGK